MSKTLSCQWAAASLDRFTAEDIANQVPDAHRSTIDDVVADLRENGLIERAAIRPNGRGRPRIEYAWVVGGRERSRETLEAQMRGLDRVRAEAADRYVEFGVIDGAHRMGVIFEQIKALVDAATTAEDPRQKTALAARAEAEYGVLKALQTEEPGRVGVELIEAGRQLERLLAPSVSRGRIGPEPAVHAEPDWSHRPAARPIWGAILAGARAPAVSVLDHYGAPLLNSGRSGGARVQAGLAHMSAPEDDFTLILDTSAGVSDQWLDAYAVQRGHRCAVLRLVGASDEELDGHLRSLLEFFVTPASANTHICMVVDESEHSNASVTEIAQVFGDPGTVRAAMDAARRTVAQAAAVVDGKVLGAAAISSIADEPDWFSRGLKRQYAIDIMTAVEDVAQETLLKATLNDPVIVSDKPFAAQGAVAGFGKVHVAGAQDMGVNVGRIFSATIR